MHEPHLDDYLLKQAEQDNDLGGEDLGFVFEEGEQVSQYSTCNARGGADARRVPNRACSKESLPSSTPSFARARQPAVTGALESPTRATTVCRHRRVLPAWAKTWEDSTSSESKRSLKRKQTES